MQDLPVLTDMHVPTLACMFNVLQLLVLDLCELLQIHFFVLFTLYSLRFTLQNITNYSNCTSVERYNRGFA